MKKVILLIGLLAMLGIVATACSQPTPEVQEKVVKETVVVTEKEVVEKEVVVTATPAAEGEAMAPTGEPRAYRIGIFEEPVSLNYWSYLGPGSSVWTGYVLTGYAPGLYALSDQRFQLVPSLAAEPAPEPTQEGDKWVVEVKMVDDAQWSDGEPITAHDVVFTHNTCKDLQLTQNWPNQCAPLGANVEAEAVDDYTVRYTFDEKPGLGVWQMGVGMAPILPEHFWGDVVEEARAFIADVQAPDVERPEDCEAEGLSADAQAACDAWAAYDDAFTNARQTLYEADPTGSPTGGGYLTDQWEPGAFVQRSLNDNYYFKGAEIVEYEDGTWQRTMPSGSQMQMYGEASGNETLRYTSGPHSPNIILSSYGSQDGAFLALSNGEVDYVLNPLGLTRGLQEQAEKGGNVVSYVNPDYGMFYLAFNMRKEPMSDPAFREAVDAVIDKEFVVNSVLQGSVFPMYSTMPPGNEFWHNPDVPKPFVGLSREERVNTAVQVLKDAGWSWETEPAWNEDRQDVDPGTGLTMPNGEPMPNLTILGPGPAYDPIRATFSQWISEWMRELGMPVESELTGFNTILGPVFQEANFDMYILGWSLGNVAFPDYFESFWHSRNDTATTGNSNTPGYNNPEYDAMVDEFMQSTDLDAARDIVFKLQTMLAEDRPYVPLFYKQVIDLAGRNVEFPYTETLGGIEFQQGMQTDTKVYAAQ
jgi:peptide/nickel transport system substrate-binding protein